MENAPEVARRIADVLEESGVDYAIGGAIAYDYWGDPRGTSDVDVNIFVPESEAERLFPILRRAGLTFDDSQARKRVAERGDFVCRTAEGMRVDVFLPSIPFYAEAQKRRVRVPDLRGRPAWVLSAEVIAVFKLLFYRSKDVGDLEHIVAHQGSKLDAAFVRSAVVDVVGEDDHRVRRWDEMVRALGPDSPRRPPTSP